jgi:hypothetical protein
MKRMLLSCQRRGDFPAEGRPLLIYRPARLRLIASRKRRTTPAMPKKVIKVSGSTWISYTGCGVQLLLSYIVFPRGMRKGKVDGHGQDNAIISKPLSRKGKVYQDLF